MNLLLLLTLLRVYVTFKPFMANRISFRALVAFSVACWVLGIVFAVVPFSKNFVHSFYVEPNRFFKDQRVGQKAVQDYIQHTVSISRHNYITTGIYDLEEHNSLTNLLNNRVFKDKDKDRFPHRYVNIKGSFGFYSDSSVCFPNFYSKQPPASDYALFAVLYNLVYLVIICIGYFMIFLRTKKSKEKSGKTANEKKLTKMLTRIAWIVITNIICWLPIIIMSIASRAGYEPPDVMHPLSSIIFLPINSILNPIIYSRLDQTVWKRVKVCFSRIFMKQTNLIAQQVIEFPRAVAAAAAVDQLPPEQDRLQRVQSGDTPVEVLKRKGNTEKTTK